MVEALCLFDEPMLNSRYHGMLSRRSEDAERRELASLPGLVLQSVRLGQEAASEWAAAGEAVPGRMEFLQWADHTILEAFLTLAENQLRIVAQMARAAPTEGSRRPFDEMLVKHREIADVLRRALKAMPNSRLARPHGREGVRAVQEEGDAGDLRGQLDKVIGAYESQGNGVRRILLSSVGLRHLRDHGSFRDGDATFRGYPVAVDMSWQTPAFVVETFDQVPLEEIMAG